MPAHPRPLSNALPSRAPLFWQLQLLGWGSFAILSLPLKQAVYGSLEAGLIVSGYQLPLSIGLSYLLRYYYRRTQPGQRSFWLGAGIVFAGCLAAGAFDVLVSLPVSRALGFFAPAELLNSGLYFFRTAIYVIWSLGYFLFKAMLLNRAQAFRAAIAEEKHRFELMRYQLNPTFLAKSLATISHQIGTNPATARAMTAKLSDFYQNTLRHVERSQTATIADELALVRTYLEIEQLRMGGTALALKYDVDGRLLSLPLPPVLLLPLAEKAIREGRATPGQPLEITVTVEEAADGLTLLEISHSGRIDPSNPPFAHTAETGPADLRASLERHFGQRYRLNLSQDSFRVRASLWLPLMA
jgi:sensor histidine kinase YesM